MPKNLFRVFKKTQKCSKIKMAGIFNIQRKCDFKFSSSARTSSWRISFTLAAQRLWCVSTWQWNAYDTWGSKILIFRSIEVSHVTKSNHLRSVEPSKQPINSTELKHWERKMHTSSNESSLKSGLLPFYCTVITRVSINRSLGNFHF